VATQCSNERTGSGWRRISPAGRRTDFVPEGEGAEIERARDKRRVTIVAAVAPSGRAAIKRLQIDGKPVYREPLF
jgi:uncharacterized membrane-anchored protein